MQTKFAVFLLAFASLASATAGSLRTRDGKFLEGTVQLDAPSGVKITLANGEQQKFPLANLDHATFTSGATTTLPPEVAALMKGRGNGLLGTYYERVDLSGRAIHRLDETVNFDWEMGEPISGVQKDYFSARWAGQLEAPVSGKFTFHLDADDGARLWLGDKLICDAWRVADSAEISGDLDLTAGQRYDLRLEYYDNLGPARLRLSWTGPGIPKSLIPRSQFHAAIGTKPGVAAPTQGLLAAYYRRTELDSSSALTRVDPQLDFNWGENAPVAELPAQSFSVRWSGQVAAQFTESYTFHVEAGGGARLWLDGQLILDQWRDQPGEFYSTVVPLTAGQKYDLRLEHFSTSKEAKLRLLWSSASQRKAPIAADALTPSRAAESSARRPQHGLLGAYFSRPDCTGELLKRLDAQVNFDWADKPAAPGVPTENFSVRWTGQVQAQHTENYTFHLEADDGVRVWLGDRQIMDEWRQQATTLVSLPTTLNAGQFYPLTIEYFSAKPPAMAKLKWSSPSTPLGIIPASRLYPPNAPSAPVPGERRLGLDRGVVTWDGSFLAAPLASADDTALQFGGAQKDFSLSTVNAARIIFQNLSAQRAAKIEPGRAGILLVNGDFVDGEFKGFERGRVKMSSVLFGLKFFDATYEVVAVFLRDPAPGAPTFRVKSSDGSVLLVKKFQMTAEGLTMDDATLRGYRVPAQELIELRQGSGTNLFSTSLHLGPTSVHAEAMKMDAAAEREWKAKAEGVRTLVLAENDKRARMDADEERKARSELDAATEADRVLKATLAKLAEQQESLTKARAELKDAEAKAEEARAAAKKALEVHDAKTAETDKLKAQHDKQKAVYAQRAQEFLAATQKRDQTHTRLNVELAAAEAALVAARRRAEQAKLEEITRLRTAEVGRKAAALAAEQGEAARAKAEAAWKAAQTDLAKAATARDEAKKLADAATAELARAQKTSSDHKLVADKAALESATKAKTAAEARTSADKLAAKAVTDKAVAEGAWTQAKTAADKAAADLASALKTSTDTKLAADKATADSANKAKAAAEARAGADKLATKSVAEKAAAEVVWTQAKAAADKAATELVSALKKAADSKLAADQATADSATKAKAAAEARAGVDKLATKSVAEKAAAEAAWTLAKTAADKAATEQASALKKAADSKLVADKAAADSATKAKTSTEARAGADKLAAKATAEKTAAEAAWTLAKAAADKAATELASASKTSTDTKLAADKAAADSATKAKAAVEARAGADKLAAKAATDKTAAEAAWNLAKAAADKTATELTSALKTGTDNKLAADKANADLAAKTRTAEEVRVKRDKLATEDRAKKGELDRLTADSAVKAAAAKTTQAAFEKTEREMKEARLKAEEQLKQADAKVAETKGSKEKQLAELNAKVTETDALRKALEKENADLWNLIQKFAAERNQLKLQQLNADSAVSRVNADVALRKRTVQSAETLVAQSTEKKLTSEKLLAEAKAALDKRARAQFK